MIICESPLAPVILKQMIAKLLFDYFQVPSISFVPTHLMALLTTGITTGLIIDVGNLETSVLPVSVHIDLSVPEANKCNRSTFHDL